MTEPLLDLIARFVAAPSWAASERLVGAHPVLLSDAADAVLGELIGAAEADGSTAARHSYEIHRALLLACRRDGIAAAFRAVLLAGIPEHLHRRWLAAAEASERYQQSGDPADLDPAVEAPAALVEDPRFTDAPGDRRALMAYALGTALIDRHRSGGDPADLDRAVTAFRVAFAASASDDPDRPDYLAAAGNALAMRHELRDETAGDDDLRGSIAALAEVVQALDDADGRLPERLGELAASLASLYDLTGEVEHLSAAIEAARRAIDVVGSRPELPGLPELLNNLVNCLTSRYERTGDLDDLRAGVGHAQRAVDLGTDSPDLPVLHATLGGVLQLRHDRDHDPRTLDRAIDALARAAAGLPARSPDRVICLGNLGNARLTRFETGRRAEDLQAALTDFAAALDEVDPRAPRAALLWCGLGLALLHRHTLDGTDADLHAAFEALESAARCAGNAPRILPFVLLTRAEVYRRADEAGTDPARLAAAVDAYRRAYAHGVSTQLELALSASAEWGRWAARRGAWDEAREALDGAMNVAEQLFVTQFDRADREVWLGAAVGLPASAAYAHARTGRLRDAVTAVERGRAQLLSDALRGELAANAPELAARLRAANQRLRHERWQPPLWSWSADLDGTEVQPP